MWRSSDCQASFISSSSMRTPRRAGVVGPLLSKALPDAADLGRDIGLADAENLGDLGVRAILEMEQDERAIERVELRDQGVELAQAFVGQAARRVVFHRFQQLVAQGFE